MKAMETKKTIEIFNSYLVDGVDSAWRKDNAWRKANKAWLRKSAQIALKINRFLKDNKITQRQLAKALEVSPQQVNKLLKGRENLTLETVSKLETILGIELVSITNSQEVEAR
jgi:ribosome-binding protein aMBF1 (putative translation factor)